MTANEDEIKGQWMCLILEQNTHAMGDLYTQQIFKTPFEDDCLEILSNQVPEMKNWDVPQLSDVASFLVGSRFKESYKLVCSYIKEKNLFRSKLRWHS